MYDAKLHSSFCGGDALPHLSQERDDIGNALIGRNKPLKNTWLFMAHRLKD